MKQIISFIIAAIVVAFLAWAVLSSIGNNQETKTQVQDSVSLSDSKFDLAPDLTFKDARGNEVSFSDFRGKTLVVNAWATWCPFCRNELVDFVRLQKEFPNDIVVLAIDRRESLEKTQEFTNSIGVTEDLLFLLDESDSFYKAIGGFAMPETIFINNNGRMVFHKRGFMAFDEMKALTIDALATNNQ